MSFAGTKMLYDRVGELGGQVSLILAGVTAGRRMTKLVRPALRGLLSGLNAAGGVITAL